MLVTVDFAAAAIAHHRITVGAEDFVASVKEQGSF